MPLNLFADMVSQDEKKYGTAKIDKRVKELIEKENWNEASTILQAVVDAQPNRAALVLLAGVELQRGRSSRAIELVEKLIKNRGSYPLAMILLGDAFLAAGRADEAQQIWEATVQVRSMPELHKRLAKLYEQVGDKDAARTQRALIFQSKGISALREANPTLAKKILQQAVEFEPTLVDSWFYLAECRRLLGELSAARDAYQSTLDLEPNHGRAITSLELISK
jgi:predicted Zn-dependent protease